MKDAFTSRRLDDSVPESLGHTSRRTEDLSPRLETRWWEQTCGSHNQLFISSSGKASKLTMERPSGPHRHRVTITSNGILTGYEAQKAGPGCAIPAKNRASGSVCEDTSATTRLQRAASALRKVKVEKDKERQRIRSRLKHTREARHLPPRRQIRIKVNRTRAQTRTWRERKAE